MSLNLEKLEKVVKLADGLCRARCPACAEGGNDRTGEHLRIYPDGRFGCCVYPKDKEHRRRIFALAGERKPQSIRVRVATGPSGGSVVTGILGRLGRGNQSPNAVSGRGQSADASDGVNEVQPQFSDSRAAQPEEAEFFGDQQEESRTARTPLENPRVYPEKELGKSYNSGATLKEFREGVRSVREQNGAAQAVKLPFLAAGGGCASRRTARSGFTGGNRAGRAWMKHSPEVLQRMADEKRKAEYGHGV